MSERPVRRKPEAFLIHVNSNIYALTYQSLSAAPTRHKTLWLNLLPVQYFAQLTIPSCMVLAIANISQENAVL